MLKSGVQMIVVSRWTPWRRNNFKVYRHYFTKSKVHLEFIMVCFVQSLVRKYGMTNHCRTQVLYTSNESEGYGTSLVLCVPRDEECVTWQVKPNWTWHYEKSHAQTYIYTCTYNLLGMCYLYTDNTSMSLSCIMGRLILIHWDSNKMVAILQTTFLTVFVMRKLLF